MADTSEVDEHTEMVEDIRIQPNMADEGGGKTWQTMTIFFYLPHRLRRASTSSLQFAPRPQSSDCPFGLLRTPAGHLPSLYRKRPGSFQELVRQRVLAAKGPALLNLATLLAGVPLQTSASLTSLAPAD